jgi:hypothetical protein
VAETQSIVHYVDVSVSTTGVGPQPASFGVPAFFHQHALETARVGGPFFSAQEVIDAGHASGSPPHAFAQSLFSQQPRVKSFVVGRIDAGDADPGVALNATIAENPGAFYGVAQESRADADVLAMAAAIEAAAFPKIYLAQSSAASLLAGEGPSYSVTAVTGTPPPADGNYDLIFTGFGLVTPETITVAVAAGVPADDTALMAAFDAALDTAAGPAGVLENIVDPASISNATGTLLFKILDGLASGTVTTATQAGTTLTATTLDADVGSRLFDLGYLRTALAYYPTDATFLDAAWLARCLSFNLDQRKGIWAYKSLQGIAGTNLSNVQVTNLRNVNANYYGPAVMSAGTVQAPFTAQGWMSGPATPAAGRRIDVTTTLDWAKARLEEGFTGVIMREPNGIPLDNAGINRFVASARRHFTTGVNARHYLPFQVPEGEEHESTDTPAIFAPKESELTVAQRTARELSITALAYLQSFAEKVIFTMEARQ